MHYPTLMLWAFASILLIDGRFISSTNTQQSARVVWSFQEVTTTYTAISTYFSKTRSLIESSQSFEECSSSLTLLYEQITQAVDDISGGCDCDIDGSDQDTVQNLIATWFSELQTITRLLQRRYPTRYTSFKSTFSQISFKIEYALGVSYAAGVNIDDVVQTAVQKTNVNRNLFSTFGIDTSRFTRVSQSVNNRSGTFTNHAPAGTRFPDLLPEPSRRHGAHKPKRPSTDRTPTIIDPPGVMPHEPTPPRRQDHTSTPINTPTRPNLLWPPAKGRETIIDQPGVVPDHPTYPTWSPNGGRTIIDHPITVPDSTRRRVNFDRTHPISIDDTFESKPVSTQPSKGHTNHNSNSNKTPIHNTPPPSSSHVNHD